MLRWATSVLLGAVGYALGFAIHGNTPGVLLPTLAGLAGGFGVGCSGLHVVNSGGHPLHDPT